MASPRLLWRLYTTYLIVILLCTLAVGVNAVSWIDPFYYPGKQRELAQKARLIERRVLDAITPLGNSVKALSEDVVLDPLRSAVDPLCRETGELADVRVTVVLLNGKVIGDSQENPADMDDHSDRPEIGDALRTGEGMSRRPSPTLGIEMMYVAIPLEIDGERIGTLRLSLALTDLAEAVVAVSRKIITGAVVVAIMASVLALLISRWISRPLEEMRRGADRFARGDFRQTLLIPEAASEMKGLAESLNSMAGQLDERIRTIIEQRQELAAVLSSMSEGVLAVDGTAQIISINEAAVRMFNIENPAAVEGRVLAEVIRIPVLQDLVSQTWSSRDTTDGEIVIDMVDGQHQVEVGGSVIRGPGEKEVGVLIMLRDVTRLRQFERLRRDFVANVSHELKTPVTSIQGFVETLREGAAKDPEKVDRFLGIVADQADRLGAIIDDLLSLSRLEQSPETEQFEMMEAAVSGVIRSAVAMCEHRASEGKVDIRVDCPADLCARANPQLLEQAICNLLDNAIKFSEVEGVVSIEAEGQGDNLVIAVRDTGAGIAAEHLARIFERFYRVDKGRSRDFGGTGLGLAIVKHIVQAHGGSVGVDSTVGKGSTFTVFIPTLCPSC
jgi:two-component system, OmpR family, phosphate regulon sensor histidine kinase PhoR